MTSAPILLLHGTDELAIRTHLTQLEETLGDSSTVDMNVTRLDGRSLDFEALNTAINAVPFLAERRLVVLEHTSAAFPSAQGRKKFLETLAAIPPTTTLALVEPGILNSDHWLLKWARTNTDKARLLACMLPRRREMPDWIMQESQKQGGKIERQAAERLAEMTGEDTRSAAQEITKLLTFVDFARPIGLQDVEQVSVVSAQAVVFDMVDALAMGKGQTAQKALHRLLEDEDPLSLWGMVIRQFRLLLLAREIIEAGGRAREIQDALALHDFVADKIYQQAQRFSLPRLEALYRHLLEIDEGIKTSRVTIDLALDTLVVELAQEKT